MNVCTAMQWMKDDWASTSRRQRELRWSPYATAMFCCSFDRTVLVSYTTQKVNDGKRGVHCQSRRICNMHGLMAMHQVATRYHSLELHEHITNLHDVGDVGMHDTLASKGQSQLVLSQI